MGGVGCKELHSCTVSQGNLRVWLGGGPETQIMRSKIAGSLFPVEKGQEQRSVEEALESSSPQKGSGDPDWDRRVSFSMSDTSLRAGGVLDCKGARGIRIAGHMCVPIWESDRSTSTSGRGILKPVAG